MAHRLLVTGDRACFLDDGVSGRAVTLSFMPPRIARGIFESIHWTPSITWNVEKIIALNSIKKELHDSGGEDRLVLKDVAYLIFAKFELTSHANSGESVAGHAEMFKRRAQNGRHFRQPYLGLRDYPAKFRYVGKDEAARIEAAVSQDQIWTVKIAPTAKDERISDLEKQLAAIRLEVGRIAALTDNGQDKRYVPPETIDHARFLYRLRRRRDATLGEAEFGEADWDILLDLFIAEHDGRLISVSSACIAASVPPSTALRHLNRLVESGVIVRVPDPLDRRRAWLRLSPKTHGQLTAVLGERP